MGSVTNVKLGTCKIYLNGVDLGHTIGGAEVKYTPDFHETKVDQFSGVVERFLIGEKLSAKVPMAEFTLNNIKAAMPFGTQATHRVTLGANAGKRASDHANLLVLHPIENADSDRSADVAIYKAVSVSEVTIALKNDGEKILEVTFEGLVDENRTDGNLLGLIGDSIL